MKSIFRIFVLATVVVSQATFAGETLNTKIHNQYISLRAMGMGNAFTAVADDYSLIFYNPAGFAFKKQNEIQMTFAGAQLNSQTIPMYNDIDKASKKGNTDEEKAQNIANALEPYYGKTIGSRIQAVELFWIRKNWGMALIPIDLSLDMTVNKQVGPSIDLNVKGDTTFAYGYGTELNKQWAWGITAKAIHRISADENLPVLELAANSNVLSASRMKEGIAGDLDIGLLYSPDWFVKKRKPAKQAKKVKPQQRSIAQAAPATASLDKKEELSLDSSAATSQTITTNATQAVSGDVTLAASGTVTTSGTVSVAASGTVQSDTSVEVSQIDKKNDEEPQFDENYPLTFSIVARNLLGGKFSKMKLVNKDATTAPEKMPTVVDIGSQCEITKLGSFVIRTMIDFKNIMHPEITLNKSLHAGLEFDFSPSGYFKTQLRGGLNQGYYTAGATFLLGVFNIEAATYGEEVGTTSNKLENRVYAAKFGMNF